MADFAGNPTATNVPAAQQLSTLVPTVPTVPTGIPGSAPAPEPVLVSSGTTQIPGSPLTQR